MIIRIGNMWKEYEESDFFCITTNSYIRKNGALAMGRGVALEAKNRFPKLPFIFGKRIKHMSEYYLIDSFENKLLEEKTRIMAFQVKTHYLDNAEHELIRKSTEELAKLAKTFSKKRFDLNFPGIGYGRLTEKEVLPIIETLPDNVNIWKLK